MICDVTCREFVEFLDDYLAGALPEQRRTEFNAHLALCPSCVAYMKTYKQSGALARKASLDDEVPDDVPEELVKAILAAKGR